MSEKQKRVINLIEKMSPKSAGIKAAYYKAGKNRLDIYFIIEEKNAPLLISYLNSLALMIQREIKGIKIESNVYIKDETTNKQKDFIQKESLETIRLANNLCLA